MNTNYQAKGLLSFYFLLLLFSVQAQNEVAYNSNPLFVDNKTHKVISKKGNGYNKKVPAVYSGYAIELKTSEFPLIENDKDFQNFGKVYYDKTMQGTYSYVILADFNRKQGVIDYINNVVKYRIKSKKLKVVEYKNGRRKEEQQPIKRKYNMID